jgi:hypothetical protein
MDFVPNCSPVYRITLFVFYFASLQSNEVRERVAYVQYNRLDISLMQQSS